MGSNPNRLTAPALRGIKNALLQGVTSGVDRDAVTIRVINGAGKHTNTSQKGAILSAQSISPENVESRKIAPSGDRLMHTGANDGRPLIRPYRKFRLVSNGNVKNPLHSPPLPSADQSVRSWLVFMGNIVGRNRSVDYCLLYKTRVHFCPMRIGGIRKFHRFRTGIFL